MTREQFKNETPFRCLGTTVLKYKFVSDPENTGTGYIEEFGQYMCNVSKITETGFHWFTIVFNKKVNGIIKFDDCHTTPASVNLSSQFINKSI